eukprot:1162134-Pelagomonas_calceolata.AAC.5
MQGGRQQRDADDTGCIQGGVGEEALLREEAQGPCHLKRSPNMSNQASRDASKHTPTLAMRAGSWPGVVEKGVTGAGGACKQAVASLYDALCKMPPKDALCIMILLGEQVPIRPLPCITSIQHH